MRIITLITIILVFTTGCQPPARLLIDTELGMSKKEVKRILGNPESLALSFKTKDGKYIEVWNYRLYQYEMAMSVSPYFDIYSLIFVNGELNKIEKTEKGTRLSEAGALKLMGYPDNKIELNIK